MQEEGGEDSNQVFTGKNLREETSCDEKKRKREEREGRHEVREREEITDRRAISVSLSSMVSVVMTVSDEVRVFLVSPTQITMMITK